MYMIEVVAADVLAQLPDRRIAQRPTTPAQAEARSGGGKQSAKVRRLLPKCYPPDGAVSDEIPTKTVQQVIIAKLEEEARSEGVLKDKQSKLPNPPSWDVVNRVLGRGK